MTVFTRRFGIGNSATSRFLLLFRLTLATEDILREPLVKTFL